LIDLIGSIREVCVEDTLQRALAMDVWRTVGLTRLADVTGLDHIGINTFVAVRPNAKCLTTSQGKGVTKELAKVSALMEAIEIWHAEEIRDPCLYGSYEELNRRHSILDFVSLAQCSEFRVKDFTSIPMSWVEARDMWTGEQTFVPWSLCSVDYTRMRPEAAYLAGSTNGLASGNSIEEALCHALFEVVERETESTFETASPATRQIDLSTISSVHILSLLRACEAAGIAVYIYDMTLHIRIPTFCAIICDCENSARNPGTFRGTGTHLSPEIALSRALTEAIQSRVTVISGSRDDLSPEFYLNAHRQFGPEMIRASSMAGTVSFQPRVEALPSSFPNWIREILGHLMDAGFCDASYVDLTNPDLGIPVVKVLVPGCRFDALNHVNRPRRRHIKQCESQFS
jgi:ribosomal protein S12 methylthiotransferase accessory factor